MTGFDVVRTAFDPLSVAKVGSENSRVRNWPVVYTLDSGDGRGRGKIYIGQTNSAATRMFQHLRVRPHMTSTTILLHDEFNRSAALDLEGWLIARFQGDPSVEVENTVRGESGHVYFDYERYRSMFPQAFQKLKKAGLFSLDLELIENTEFFKLSPYKTLTEQQDQAIQAVLDGVFEAFREGRGRSFVVEGGPGTGKTVVAITMLKQLVDVAQYDPALDDDPPEEFAGYRTEAFRAMLPEDLKIGFVIPQQALRDTVRRVFAKTSGLHPEIVLTPYDVANAREPYDLLIVDEAHRLEQPGNHGTQNKRYDDAGRSALGDGGENSTMLDWIRAKSVSQVFLFDIGQSIRPVDVPARVLEDLKRESTTVFLPSQLRVRAGDQYVGFVRQLLQGSAEEPAEIRSEYDFRFFDDPVAMYREIRKRDDEVGLSRMLAGFAWKWPQRGRNDPDAVHVTVGDLALPWNRTEKDWANSKTAIEEVGCIHTIQGYDLNYAGVIIGPDLKMDPETGRVSMDWDSYHDPRKERTSSKRGIKRHSDDELLEDLVNIYSVLMTRGISGTYVYVVDPPLREYLRQFIPAAECP